LRKRKASLLKSFGDGSADEY